MGSKQRDRPLAKPEHEHGRGTSSGRLVDGLTQELRDMILDQRIPPGTTLLQTEWAERLNVSRTPLREAFRILEQDGLVRASNGNGTIQVVESSLREIHDLFQVREAIDGLAARLVANRGLSDDLDRELADLLGVMDRSTDPFTPADWFAAHATFHLRIAENCGNTRVCQQLDLIRITSVAAHSQLADPALPEKERRQILEVAQRQHHAIYAALRTGSGDLAELAASEHIRTTLQRGSVASDVDDATKRAG